MKRGLLLEILLLCQFMRKAKKKRKNFVKIVEIFEKMCYNIVKRL